MFLPFSLRTSPFLFDLFAKSFNWMLLQRDHDTMHYLDNFLGVFSNLKLAEKFSHDFHAICHNLGMNINLKKSQQGQILEFLGIKLDTILMQACLPSDKLQKAKDLVEKTLIKSTLTVEELDSLV